MQQDNNAPGYQEHRVLQYWAKKINSLPVSAMRELKVKSNYLIDSGHLIHDGHAYIVTEKGYQALKEDNLHVAQTKKKYNKGIMVLQAALRNIEFNGKVNMPEVARETGYAISTVTAILREHTKEPKEQSNGQEETE